MKNRSGFTLIEISVTVVIIGILAVIGTAKYTAAVERSRGAEAKEVLMKMYAGYQRLVVEGESTSGLTWARLGMSDPNADARRYFDYTIVGVIGGATRRTGASKWMNINLTTGVMNHSGHYF